MSTHKRQPPPSDEIIKHAIAVNVRRLLSSRKLTIVEVARRMSLPGRDIHKSFVYHIINGKHKRAPNACDMYRLALALNSTVDALCRPPQKKVLTEKARLIDSLDI